MKKLYLGLAAMLLPSALTAGTVAANDALSVALDFYNSLPVQSSQGSVTKIPKAQITSTDLVRVNMPVGNLEAFNVRGNRGFVIVNPEGEDCPIIGYSDKGYFDASNLPPQLKKALEQPVTFKANHARSNAPSPVVLYQTAEWGQNAPFNDLCPTVDGQKAPAGCVATAMAITMKYHNWPDCTRGGEETDFYFPDEKFDFDNYTINWDALDSNDAPGFATQAAQLTYSAGVAAQMIYGAWESSAEVWTVSHQLQYFYAYDKECQHLPREKFDDMQWDAMLRAQLDETGPVIYHGNGSIGHCFVIDGYNSDGMYHVNWGWDGGSNGYYSLDFSLDGGLSFGEAQGMIINIKPDKQKKEYSRAWIPNAEVYIGGAFGVNGWNFMTPDILPETTISFKAPFVALGGFCGYYSIAVVDEADNIIQVMPCWGATFDGYRYYCAFPGSDPGFRLALPELKDGQRYQLVTQEVPNKNPSFNDFGYTAAYEASENPEDWRLILGGIVYPAHFYANGNRSEISEVRFHIDESMPFYCFTDNTFENEFTLHGLKGGSCPQNTVLPRKGVSLEIKSADWDGNPSEALYVGEEDEYIENVLGFNLSLYDDQFDVYIKYEFDGDTRKDSEFSADEIVEKDGLVYKIDDYGLTLIGYDKVGESVTIPNSIVVEGNEFIVRSISSEALMFAPIKDLKIECEELTVGPLSFAGTEKLETVTFEDINLQTTPFQSVPFVKSGVKTVYMNGFSGNDGIFYAISGVHAIADKTTFAIKDVDFVLTGLPESYPNECFSGLWEFNGYAWKNLSEAVKSYIIPGIGSGDLSAYIGNLECNIQQMWTYEIDKSSGLVRFGNVMENVEIESIFINDIKATADADGIYSIDALSPEGGMAVTVNYTINGLKNTAVYSADLNNNIVGTVLNFNVESIILSYDSWNAREGESIMIEATVMPEYATDKTVTWSSSDESIAVVDEYGTVTAVGVGNAIITATCGGVKSECAVKCYPRLGDANWNGEITITDAVDISNYVVKKKNVPDGWEEGEWTEFYVAGANANESEDGMVTIADASATVELALSQPVAASPQYRVGAAHINSNVYADALVPGAIRETGDGRIAISFNLDNTMEYVALQADIAIPEGIPFEVNPGSRAVGHTLQDVRVDDSHIRIALFNLGNKAFTESNEALFEIVVDGGISDIESLTIFNILASDAEANEFVLDYAPEVMSGIDRNVMTDIAITKVPGAIHVSNAVGHRIEVCTVDGRIVKSFIANDALEIIKLPAGLYIVKTADKTLKVVL